MATERVVIEVQLKGARQADKGVRQVGETSRTTSKAVDNLKRATDALSPTLAKVGGGANSFATDVLRASSSASQLRAALAGVNSVGADLGGRIAGASGSLRQLQASLQGVNGAGLKFGTTFRQAAKDAGTIGPLLEKVRRSSSGAASGVDALTQRLRGGSGAADQFTGALRRTEQQERRVEQASRRLGGVLSGLRGIFAGFLGILGARKLLEVADAYTIIQNRLKTVTESTGQLAFVQGQLFEVAQRTRVGFRDLANVYARTRAATVALGVSEQETINFTESLSQAVKLSGASSTEASNAMIQLTQGLASGALRGDELRSVLEQLPTVADVIAKGLGVTRGELRKLGADGKITAEVILKAFKEARGELSEKFAKAAVTVSDSFTVLGNSFTKFVGELNEATGATALFTKLVIGLANNLDTIVRVVAGLAIGIGAVVVAIKGAAVATAAWNAVLALNPVVLVATAIAAAIGLLITFADKITFASVGMANLGDLAAATWDVIVDGLRVVAGVFSDTFAALRSAFAPAFEVLSKVSSAVFGEMELSFAGVVRAIAKGLDLIVTHFGRMFLVVGNVFGAIVKAGKRLGVTLGDIFVAVTSGIFGNFRGLGTAVISVWRTTFNAVAKLSSKLVSLITNDTQKAAQALGTEVKFEAPKIEANTNAFAQFGSDLAQGLADAASFQFTGFSDAVDRILDGAAKRAEDRRKRQAQTEADIAAAARAAQERGARTAPEAVDKDSAKSAARLAKEIQKLKDARAALRIEIRGEQREAHVLSEVLRIERAIKRELTQTERERVEGLLREIQALEDQIAIKQVTDQLDRDRLILLEQDIIKRQALTEVLRLEDQLKRKLTDAERTSIETRVRANAELAEENSLYEKITSAQTTYAKGTEVLNRLLDQGRITQAQFNDELRDMRIAALDAQTTLSAGLERGLLKFAKTAEDSAAQMENALTNAFGAAEDAFVEFVKTGKLDFSSLIDSILSDLARAAFKQQVAGLLGSTGGSGGGGGSGLLGALGGLAGAFFGGGGGSSFSGSGFGGMTNSSILAGVGNPAGFATGGSFTVGGSGGVDSQLVAFRATPGERVRVQTPSEGSIDRDGGRGGDRPIVINMNIQTPDADSFRRSQQQTMARVEQGIRRASMRQN